MRLHRGLGVSLQFHLVLFLEENLLSHEILLLLDPPVFVLLSLGQ